MRIAIATVLCAPLLLTGCALNPTASPTPSPGAAIRGNVHGGQQPIVGAHVYVFAANTNTYAGPGIAPSTSNASLSLLSSASTGKSDSIGAYVTTDATGSFVITGDYICSANTQIYLYALGGNPGAGINPAAGLLAALGNCPAAGNFQAATPFIWINEVSTVAAAYAFAGFASDATHVSSTGTALAQTGMANAFANAVNIASISTGAALTTTPGGNGTAPQTEINTLANILASCINSTGAVTGPSNPTTCYTLFYNAESGGSTGTIPTDTATAAINIAHNPNSTVAALYNIPPPAVAFAPALTAQPADFSIAIKFTGAGLDVPQKIAVDGSGNVWATNAVNSISKLYSSGAAASPSTGGFYGIGGFTGIQSPYDIAIDLAGNVWITNTGNATVTELNGAGTADAGSPFSTGAGSEPAYIAIDGSSNVWVTNQLTAGSLTKLSNAGVILSGTGFTGGGLNKPYGIAIDPSGNAWVANNATSTVSIFSSNGTPAANSPLSSGGIDFPHSIAVDSSGNIWIPNYSDTITKLSSIGTVLSGSSGFSGGALADPYGIAFDGSGNAWIVNASVNGSSVSEFSNSGTPLSSIFGYGGSLLSAATGIALDSSGNVWIANSDHNSIVELIGIATPVVTPLAYAVKTNSIASRP